MFALTSSGPNDEGKTCMNTKRFLQWWMCEQYYKRIAHKRSDRIFKRCSITRPCTTSSTGERELLRDRSVVEDDRAIKTNDNRYISMSPNSRILYRGIVNTTFNSCLPEPQYGAICIGPAVSVSDISICVSVSTNSSQTSWPSF